MTLIPEPIGRVLALAAVLTILLPLVGAPTPVVAEESVDLPMNFQANVIAVPGTGRGARGSMLEIRIREWTTEEERQQVLTEIQEASSQNERNRNRAVARALRGASRVGSMNLRGTTSWPIRYSRQSQLPDGKQRIILATDRPVSFIEAFDSSRMVGDFDVTVVDLTLDAEGNGEGTISVGTEARWNEQTGRLEIANFSTQPVRLTNIRRAN